MIIDSVILHRLNMQLKAPFQTSFGTVKEKDFYLVEVVDEDGFRGFGETSAFSTPWYTEETTATVKVMLEQILIPKLLAARIEHPDDVTLLFQPVKRNFMAKAAIEGAVWDLYAKRNGLTLAQALGGKKRTIDVGISLGMEETTTALLKKIEQYVSEGYKRVKVKVKPGKDIDVLKAIRKHFPQIPLMVDANSAYTLKDIELLKKFDDFALLMIEQPLSDDDIAMHAELQKELETPICLDESIYSMADVKLAVQLKSCKIINIKASRVGGLTNAKKMHDYCKEKGIAVWVGGMLDSGVGRAHHIALATLENFSLPGDIGGSGRYWYEDIIAPEVVVCRGEINVSDSPGIGYEIDWEKVKKHRVSKEVFQRKRKTT